MNGLAIAPGFVLPLDAVTSAAAILATRGAGKSNAAVVMAEEMWDAGVPWVAVDPKGDWWGLRSSATGKGAGLPIVVFGGRHGDVPLEPTAGHVIAELVLRERITCVLDVSQFTKADTTRFLLAFGQHLFRHADDGGAEPLHLFLEEAHEYLPQQVKGPVADLVSVWQRIVKQGRFKGLGCTLISQRSSVLNKDVLELIDTLIVMRTTGPLSRKAIDAWVRDQDVDPSLIASLPSLADGEAWIWSPGELKIMEKIRFRRRRTFDSGATPKVGQVRKAPTTIADVDLDAIKSQMAETIERAEANDPKALKAQVGKLTRRIRELEANGAAAATETVEVAVPYPAVPDGLTEQLQALQGLAEILGQQVPAVLNEMVERIGAANSMIAATPPAPVTRPTVNVRPTAPTRAAPQRPAPARQPAVAASGALPAISGAPLKIMAILARYPDGCPKGRVAMLAGITQKKSTLRNALSTLRTGGYITDSSDPLVPTPAGIAEIGEPEPLPTGPELYAHWRSQLNPSEKACLAAYVDAYPAALTRDDLAAATGIDVEKSTLRNAASRLRTLGLVDGDRADADFIESIVR